ncbi:cytokinin oxidase 5 [Striga asiatica]|uniref:Cytokinin oxidase 5 n=1 Tax=Striga asiatica TaxID=4170 RepID=A0A5A7QST4_STRAF|nr:cytokinin oxidase 5 [Striga asiatica]
MENGEGNLESEFAALKVTDSYNANGSDGLFQVMKAVEAAEATIKQQVEENNRLRSEILKKDEELEKYKSGDVKYQTSQYADRWGGHELCRTDQVILKMGNQIGNEGTVGITSEHDSPNSHTLESDVIRSNKNHAMETRIENQTDGNAFNGSLSSTLGASDNSGVSQIPSPSITLFTPTRYPQQSNLDSEFGYSGKDLISMADSGSKQDIVARIRDHEEEIQQLKRHLAEYSIKEAQISNEKYALEKRISYMRLQQQDLILAASKAVSYRQDIMEENVRLKYALQAAQQERTTYVSSLMPLLTEYSLQPLAADAQSIVSNVKEQLLVTEGKLKESQYQLAPWRSDANLSNFPQSPIYPIEIKDGLELVSQPTYSDGNMPSLDPQTAMAGDMVGLPQSGLENLKNSEHGELGRHPPFASSQSPSELSFNQTDPHHVRNNEGAVGKKVTFGDFVKNTEIDEPDNRGPMNDTEPSVNWNSKASATTTVDDPESSFSPLLPPVLEEPSSSFSEAAEDDPLPGIEGLQISGEAFPGAKQPNYLVTADDVDTYLAIEVQPLDDRKRKGELVKVFANEHRKITCDPVMHKCIEKTLYTGHVSFKLSLSVSIPYGSPDEFSIVDSLGTERILRVDSSLTDISGPVKRRGRREACSLTSEQPILGMPTSSSTLTSMIF